MCIQQSLTCFVSLVISIFLELTCGHLWASGPFRRVFTETMRTATGKIVNLHFERWNSWLQIWSPWVRASTQWPWILCPLQDCSWLAAQLQMGQKSMYFTLSQTLKTSYMCKYTRTVLVLPTQMRTTVTPPPCWAMKTSWLTSTNSLDLLPERWLVFFDRS